ncbi:family 1 glycosylhydrolase [Parasalinivibrio latis]|uniref:glycoside hydrolase family 1 protein n=1 Tax=Parasalinivibrio latis TaxID=2952610 RepID=UPI0030E457B8
MTSYDFPYGFIWGSATSALQIEGANVEGGRTPSHWEVFCSEQPDRIAGRASPHLASDHYNRMEQDVLAMRDLSHNGYRLSISWPRLIPHADGKLNPEGIRFYNRLFDTLVSNGIEPNVTLYHWDLPQWLAEKGGWENPETIDAFVFYAEACFRLFGDRVKRWVTLSEPGCITLNGYATGLHPPGKKDFATAIQVAHNYVVAHAKAVSRFRSICPNGQIGLVLNMSPFYPSSESEPDRQAALLADGLLNRWFLEPALSGSYPEDMVSFYRDYAILPHMEPHDLDDIASSQIDFIGVNYHYPRYVSADAEKTSSSQGSLCRDGKFNFFSVKNLFRIQGCKQGGIDMEPDALTELLDRIHQLAPGMPVYITENGIGKEEELTPCGTVDDEHRIDYIKSHLKTVHAAIEKGINIRGYYMWSLMDGFSWLDGYSKRYGFLYVDRNTMERHKKKSAYWFASVAANNGFTDCKPG